MREFTVPAKPADRLAVPEYAPVKLPDLRLTRGTGFGPVHDAAIKARAAERAALEKSSAGRNRQRPQNGPGLFYAESPLPPRAGRDVIDFVCATEALLPSAMGTVQLSINRASVNLERLDSGLLALASDHDTTRLMGRITSATIRPGRLDMTAEIGRTPIAKELFSELRDGYRVGFSPGFLLDSVEFLDSDDPDYNAGYPVQVRVLRFTVYEVSSTAIPRSPDAILKRRYTMSMKTEIVDGAEIVSTDDLLGLSLAAGRVALASGQGSRVQRERLSKFFAAYDDAVLDGKTRDESARAAALAVQP